MSQLPTRQLNGSRENRRDALCRYVRDHGQPTYRNAVAYALAAHQSFCFEFVPYLDNPRVQTSRSSSGSFTRAARSFGTSRSEVRRVCRLVLSCSAAPLLEERTHLVRNRYVKRCKTVMQRALV